MCWGLPLLPRNAFVHVTWAKAGYDRKMLAHLLVKAFMAPDIYYSLILMFIGGCFIAWVTLNGGSDRSFWATCAE